MSDASKSANRSSVRLGPKTTERSKVVFQEEDPLSRFADVNCDIESVPKIKKENLTIRLEDEVRIVAGMNSAAKKQTTGSIFSVVVDISKTGTLGIGVKDLSDNILAVSMLKRENNQPGPGEEAGIRLGDIIFGINFVPTREGSRTLISIIKKEAVKEKKILHIQGWRCHQLCSDNIPGYVFPRADEVIVQAYSLFRTKVFSDWERWNFIEILLGHMIEDLKLRTSQASGLDEAGKQISSSSKVRAKQMQVLDLERNILQAKGLRTALCVRIVHTKMQNDTVIYVLRVEDVESGLQWVVHRRFRDFFSLNDELLDMSHFAKEVEFPRKRISIRNTNKLVENRIIALEQYVRKMLHILTLYATMDSAASRSLRHLQNFLGVDRYVDCVHPPLVDDQRYIELMAYRFLNDFSSPACQQCVRFITTIDLDGYVETGPEGYRSVLTLVKDALAEVEQFVHEHHQQQMVQTLRDRRPDLDPEQLRSFVRKCIRRQVEAALFLPLRRNVFRIVYSFVAQKSKHMQRSMTLLQQATPNFLMVDSFVQQAKGLPTAVKAFRKVIQAYLPADQGQLLVEAAATVTELHRECNEERLRLKSLAASEVAQELQYQPVTPKHRRSANGEGAASVRRSSGEMGSSSRQHSSSAAGTRSSADNSRSRGNSITASEISNSPAARNRRHSIGNFFRSNSTSAHSTGGSAVDIASKEALADPAGVMFQSDETPETFSLPHNGSGEFVEDAPVEDSFESSRVSFTTDSPMALKQQARQVSQSKQRSMSFAAILQEIVVPTHVEVGETAKQQAAAHEERSEQDLERLNCAIFENKERAEGKIAAALAAADGDSEESEKRHMNRHTSMRMKSLLDDILDLKAEEEKPTPSSASTASTSDPATSATDENGSSDSKPKSHDLFDSSVIDSIPDVSAAAAVESEGTVIISAAEYVQQEVISADDFLPLFTFVLVQAGLPQLLLVKELMITLIDDEDTYGECGYYLATLEAATQHICDLADQYEKVARVDGLFDDGEDIFEHLDAAD